jgi:hypothetical protein
LILVLVVGLTYLLSRTGFGRHVYAVGGNAEASRRAGINVSRIKIACFIACSSLAAVAGILFASRDNSISPSTGGSTTLLYAVGAAVIGGTSLFGGKGRIIDAVIGGLVVGVIANGLPLITQQSGISVHRHRSGPAGRSQRRRPVAPACDGHREGVATQVSVRVGIIGYGLAGRLFHAPFITCTPGLELTHVVTRSGERAREAAADSPGVAVVPGVAELLAADVDLVVVASPSGLHAGHAAAALDAGRHVVLDKPPAADATQFEDLMAAAERVGRHLIVFHNRRWDSDYRTLRTVLDGGTLGTVHRFETSMERWRPQGKGGWRESAAPGDLGGLRYDLGPHLVDQALQLFGPVNEVSARGCSRCARSPAPMTTSSRCSRTTAGRPPWSARRC